MHGAKQVAAVLATLVAVLHVFYASQGGITDPPALAWLLALGTVAGSALVWTASRRGPWGMAWPGFSLLALPAILAWPAIGVSPGGQLALLLLLATLATLLVAQFTLAPKRSA